MAVVNSAPDTQLLTAVWRAELHEAQTIFRNQNTRPAAARHSHTRDAFHLPD